jgi:type II secretory pathway component GspD/PulD (secretin)
MSRSARALLLLWMVLWGGALAAQEAPGVARTEAGVEFDFQNADLQVVLSALADVAGLNVVFGDLPARRVTLRTSRPIQVAEVRGYLESVVRSNNLAIVEEGGLLRIVPADVPTAAPARPLAGRAADRTLQGGSRLCIQPLRFASADELARTLTALFGTGGDFLDLPDQPQALSQQLRGQRLPPFTPETPPAQQPGIARPRQDLAAGLQGDIHVVPDTRTNSLIIRATPADCETLRAAIQELDTRPLQVMIEVLILEVRRDRQLALGIDVHVPEQRVGRGDTRIGGELVGRSAGDVTLRIVNLGGVDADVLIRALAATARVNILSRPTLLTENNQEARILVGSQRPFIQVFRALPTDAAVRDQVVQYRDVGTSLTIRPIVSPEGYVSLSILQEVSTATTETQFGAPVISTREARTQLLAHDGQTVVLGGLIDQQRELVTSGIPFLQDIPLLGALFRSTQWRRNHTELFLFLTPHVLRTDEDLNRVTRRVQERPLVEGTMGEADPLLPAEPVPAMPPGSGAPRPPQRPDAQTP